MYTIYRPVGGLQRSENEDLYNEFAGRKIEDSLKKLICNLCETLAPYKTKLRIEGTVGLVMDENQMMLIHFDEKINKPTQTNNDFNNTTVSLTNDEIISEITSEHSTDSYQRPSSYAASNAKTTALIADRSSPEDQENENIIYNTHSIDFQMSQLEQNSSTVSNDLFIPNSDNKIPNCQTLGPNRTIIDMTSDMLAMKPKQMKSGNSCEIRKLLGQTILPDNLSPHSKKAENAKPISASEVLKQMSNKSEMSGLKDFQGANLNMCHSNYCPNDVNSELSEHAMVNDAHRTNAINNQTLLRELLTKNQEEPSRKRCRSDMGDQDIFPNAALYRSHDGNVDLQKYQNLETTNASGHVDHAASFSTGDQNQSTFKSVLDNSEFKYSRLLNLLVGASTARQTNGSRSCSPEQDLYQDSKDPAAFCPFQLYQLPEYHNLRHSALDGGGTLKAKTEIIDMDYQSAYGTDMTNNKAGTSTDQQINRCKE